MTVSLLIAQNDEALCGLLFPFYGFSCHLVDENDVSFVLPFLVDILYDESVDEATLCRVMRALLGMSLTSPFAIDEMFDLGAVARLVYLYDHHPGLR